jgi:hypothetical protein
MQANQRKKEKRKMDNGGSGGTLILLIGIVIAFFVGLFSSRKTAREDAKIIDLTGKIKDNKQKSAQEQEIADKAVKEYQDALKAYDPSFHNDDGDGKPSA